MNQHGVAPHSAADCHQGRITALWERLARELAEEWCGSDAVDEDAFPQEGSNTSLDTFRKNPNRVGINCSTGRDR